MKITLQEWARRNFCPQPKIATLRAWAASGQIKPAPVKVGRLWMVEEDAQYQRVRPLQSLPDISPRAKSILLGRRHGAAAQQE
jgi:hypothetical protein